MVICKRSLFMIPVIMLMILTLGTGVFASENKVYDFASLFTDIQKNELQEKATLLSEQLELDILIVTINDDEGKTSRQYAEDFYKEHDFGFAGTSDGILYLLNMDSREVYIFTRDIIVDYFPDARIEATLDAVYPYLGEEKFSESADVFLDEVEKVMYEGLPISAGNGPSTSQIPSTTVETVHTTNDSELIKELTLYLLISIGLGAVTVGIMAMNNRGRSTVNARTYLENNSFVVTNTEDQYVRTMVTQQKIQRNTGSGGVSGSSFGSGGGRSGGGGRKF
ncbi:TPM domain-containing protein [Schinkia azotoformans]|uniref:TPM domain-containing protein n=1 Tax=Schinkia azotoformans TaxID=1454 RepID=UPI002DBEF527|nr:TPM domain-containing protein [Schinkia azotoformans]MEC1717016.1 TPM domain-containing protein [Schinkia azotoformans]MEC1741320.1 TPM domain-containing protein [Schinkia azotoformans]MEC1747489.1 TPM domain-containing protein [Schinkia azotoformans]MEC1758071.1 TPM domain-containing protein [Schinkia azotoformans]MEC1769170.1 TPM domain-containing protein [Schinkia azotoformans]